VCVCVCVCVCLCLCLCVCVLLPGCRFLVHVCSPRSVGQGGVASRSDYGWVCMCVCKRERERVCVCVGDYGATVRLNSSTVE
jgi:hypothetical protein